MTSYLYVLSIGPVQDFISAARRTRDLWFGSHLLSEISKSAAKAIADNGGELIFPAPENVDQLKPSVEINTFNVSNIILAELTEGSSSSPFDVDQAAQLAGQKRWREVAKSAKSKAEGIVDASIWEDQICLKDRFDDVIEFYSAWVPWDPSTSGYQIARSRLMRLHAGRKSIRDFSPAKGAPIPKSSLDGARESVFEEDIHKPGKIPDGLAFQLRLSPGEQLCAVGLTKRLGGEKTAFPSVVRVALDPWVRGVMHVGGEAEQLLGEIEGLCEDSGFAAGMGERYGRLYKGFKYDGHVLYPSRLKSLMDSKKSSSDKPKIRSYENQLSPEDHKKLDKIKILVDRLQKKDDGGLGLGEPDPYLAILIADGDRMGKAISDITSAPDHRKLSRNLAKFAGDARTIVEEDHRGCLVFSGGDDVIAFLPVDKCLSAAKALHDKFSKLLSSEDPADKGPFPTLSVGIAIGHCLEPLEDLLEYAKKAEKSAKNPDRENEPDRDGLAVHLHMRGGGEPVKVREQWPKDPGKDGLVERIDRWVAMYLDDKLPDKAAYDIRELARAYAGWHNESEDLPGKEPGDDMKIPPDLLIRDLKRLLKKKRAGHGTNQIEQADLEYLASSIDSFNDLISRTGELIIARKIAWVRRQTREDISGVAI